MLVSWKWLKDYVALKMSQDELVERLAMAGLNHEESQPVGDDLLIDLEVTSNRPDCLGHIGVAREVSVLWRTGLCVPSPQPAAAGPPVTELTKVAIECPQLCSRYTARVLQGVRIGPSPQWLVDRLATIGIPAINNVVDVTNYVMMECGQPLHAFDFAKLAGPEIIVREARPGELFEAINHKSYPLEPGMCVIADAQRAVALGGVMGGAETEVSEATTDVLIEAADFAPLAIRTTARKLILHSPSSYRFERGVDPVGVDWASRRCCELILQLAGGRLAEGVISVGQGIPVREPIVLRLSQLPRVIGIEIPGDEVRRILAALGCQDTARDDRSLTVVPPSWRRDLTREIDLIEEVARIYGYDRIPEDVGVPMAPSHRSDEDRVLGKVRQVLLCAGFDEAMTASVVPEDLAAVHQPVDGRRRVADQHAHAQGRRPPAAKLDPEPAGGASRERIAGQSGDRAVRDGAGFPALGRRFAAGTMDAGDRLRWRLPSRQRRRRSPACGAAPRHAAGGGRHQAAAVGSAQVVRTPRARPVLGLPGRTVGGGLEADRFALRGDGR